MTPKDAEAVLASLAADEADVTLDLAGCSGPEAIARLEARLRAPEAGLWVAVHFPAPAQPGEPSLFQPVGRRLLAAAQAHAIRGLKALDPQEGALGFRFRFPGSKPPSPDSDEADAEV